MKLKLISHNCAVKLICLIMAVLVWFYVSSERTGEESVGVPVKVRLADGMSVNQISPQLVETVLSGPQKELSRLADESLSIDIDLSSQKTPAVVRLALQKSQLKLPAGVEVEEFHPIQVEIGVDRLVNKDLTVEISFSGSPQDGYRMVSFNANPEVASFSGGEKLLADMSRVSTVPVDLTGRNRSFTQSVPLVPVFPGEDKSFRKMVDVYVDIAPEPATREFLQVPVNYLARTGSMRKVTLSPDSVAVDVEGPANVIGALDFSKLLLFVDVSGLLEDGTYRLPVNHRAPAKVRIVRISPPEIEATVE